MITLSQAILAVQPNAEFMIESKDYSKITWLSPGVPQPTEEEVLAKKAALEAAELWDSLRTKRTQLLSDTDWEVVKHKELGTNISAALKTYRQELRDLPANTSDPANPTWPTKP
tara:strand:- start:5889 stop:6230 length:342 start_codon:yes stop_codon:yes gene_type:complete